MSKNRLLFAGTYRTEANPVRRRAIALSLLLAVGRWQAAAVEASNVSDFRQQGIRELLRGNLTQAKQCYEKALSDCPETYEKLFILSDLAVVARRQHRLTDFTKQVADLASQCRNVHDLASAENQAVRFVIIRRLYGQSDETEESYREVVRQQFRTSPALNESLNSFTRTNDSSKSHWKVLSAEADSACKQKDKLGAERSLERALKMALEEKQVFGSLECMDKLAVIAIDNHDLAKAESTASEALAIRRKLLWNDHPDVVANTLSLADILKQERKYTPAHQLYLQVISLKLDGKRLDIDSLNRSLAGIVELSGLLKDRQGLLSIINLCKSPSSGMSQESRAELLATLANFLMGTFEVQLALPLYTEAVPELLHHRQASSDPLLRHALLGFGIALVTSGDRGNGRQNIERALHATSSFEVELPIQLIVSGHQLGGTTHTHNVEILYECARGYAEKYPENQCPGLVDCMIILSDINFNEHRMDRAFQYNRLGLKVNEGPSGAGNDRRIVLLTQRARLQASSRDFRETDKTLSECATLIAGTGEKQPMARIYLLQISTDPALRSHGGSVRRAAALAERLK